MHELLPAGKRRNEACRGTQKVFIMSLLRLDTSCPDSNVLGEAADESLRETFLSGEMKHKRLEFAD